MKLQIDIRDGIDPVVALKYVQHVIESGRISNNGKSYCLLTEFKGSETIYVATRLYRKSDCFVVYKNINI